jgi:hypothetical protein
MIYASTLSSLAVNTYTIRLNTSDTVNPTISLSVIAIYPHGLEFRPTRGTIDYTDAVATSAILGGGSYSWDTDTSTLTLTDIDFTTLDDIALTIYTEDPITINVVGTNNFKTTHTASDTYGIAAYDLTIKGTGVVTAEATNGSAYYAAPTIDMTDYTWTAVHVSDGNDSGTGDFAYDSDYTKVTIAYRAPTPPPPPETEPEATTTTTAEETTTTTEETTTTTTEETTTSTTEESTTTTTTATETTTTTAAPEETTTTTVTTTTPAETTTTTTTATTTTPAPVPIGPSGPSTPTAPSSPPQTDIAPPPPKDESDSGEGDEEPKEEDGKSLQVNGNTMDIAVNVIEDGKAEIRVNGRLVETSSVTAADYIDSGSAKEVFLTSSGAVAIVTNGGNVIAGANESGTLNSASTVAAIKAASESEEEVDVCTGNDVSAISKGAMVKIAETAEDAGVNVNIVKSQYNEHTDKPDELIYRITLEATVEGARDVVLTAKFSTDVVEATMLAFERTMGKTDLSAFSLDQKDSYGQSAKIQVKASAIGFEAAPGDVIFVAIFNPETGEFVQVEGVMGSSGFVTFETELSGIVVMSHTSFK